MSTKPRKRLTAEARRELIELAAVDVFTERGYHGASIEAIVRRAGVTPPVFYDHFPSKVALHRRLLERTRDELLEMWRTSLAGDAPAEQRVPRAFDAWARYVQANPYAPRMYFSESTGDPEIAAVHREVLESSVDLLAAMVSALQGGPADPVMSTMESEIIRGGLTRLAIWWADNPEVPREQIVAAAMNTVWLGFDRIRAGEAWKG
ncbi:MAG: hypothetical protein QOG62_500 [Thermoleophilaceae bacterium]|nr:hypothetical protein [Thermoleophilaceae bacterium]